jgi:hypothetical protein
MEHYVTVLNVFTLVSMAGSFGSSGHAFFTMS